MSRSGEHERLARQNQTLAQAMASMGIRLESSIKMLSAIAGLTCIPTKDVTFRDAAEEVLEILVREMGNIGNCSLLVYRQDQRLLTLLAARGPVDLLEGPRKDYNKDLSFHPGEGVAGKVYVENEPCFWERGGGEDDLLERKPELGNPEALACLPLSTSRGRLGVLNISFDSKITFDFHRKRDLMILSGVVANVLQSTLLKVEVEELAGSLRDKISECETEIARRKKYEEELSSARNELEARVEARTEELRTANESLRQEILERQRSEDERRRLETQLQLSQKMEAIGTLAGGIAHDFNNILFPIIGYTELAMEDIDSEKITYTNLQEVLKAAERARDLVQQILTFSRQGERKRTPVRIQAVVKETLRLLRSTFPSTIQLRTAIRDDCGPVFADATQVQQVVMNLGTNAYHAMREQGGTLSVALEMFDIHSPLEGQAKGLVEGKYVVLDVSDTGPGIDESHLDRIFDPFFTTKAPGEGTGMGLAVVHGIVKRYGGQVAVETKPGEGTRFRVFFPMVDAEVGREEENGPTTLPHGSERILIVDDEAPVLDTVQQMLESLGYHVTPRSDSLTALETFRERPQEFDLVITDMTMPNMTGASLARNLMDIRPGLPIILCTGFSEIINEDKAKALGVKEYLQKPVAKREMAMKVRRALDLMVGE